MSEEHSLAAHLPHHARLLIPSRVQVGRITREFTRPPDPSSPAASGGDPSALPLHLRPDQAKAREEALRHQEQHPVTHRFWVPFPSPFPVAGRPVHVLVGISEFSTEQEHVRMRCSAHDSNATGFMLVLGSWMDPAPRHMTVSWLATDLPPRQVQVLMHEQHLRTVEWGVAEKTFAPALPLQVPDEDVDETVEADPASGGGSGDAPADAPASSGDSPVLQRLLSNKMRPSLLSVIQKIDQRADAYWAKFEVQALSVTPIGFTSVLRPWGDAPTFWFGAGYLASALPLQVLQAGEHSAANERLGSRTIRFARKMLCEAPSVLAFTTQVDQGPKKRASRVVAHKVTNEKFELMWDLRGSRESILAKFSWIAVC